MSEGQCLTFAYKRVGDVSIHFDIFLPPNIPENAGSLGAVVSFHAGGLACGNRKSWFPHWLYSKVSLHCFLFVIKLLQSASLQRDMPLFYPTIG